MRVLRTRGVIEQGIYTAGHPIGLTATFYHVLIF